MLCYKRQRNDAVCNELTSGTVGWVIVWEFCSSNPEGSIPYFLFLGLGLVLVLGLGLGLGF